MFHVLEVDISLSVTLRLSLSVTLRLPVDSEFCRYIACFCFICHLQLFTGVYGCGSSTAHRWYDLGHRTIQDIKDNAELLKLNVQQKCGRW